MALEDLETLMDLPRVNLVGRGHAGRSAKADCGWCGVVDCWRYAARAIGHVGLLWAYWPSASFWRGLLFEGRRWWRGF